MKRVAEEEAAAEAARQAAIEAEDEQRRLALQASMPGAGSSSRHEEALEFKSPKKAMAEAFASLSGDAMKPKAQREGTIAETLSTDKKSEAKSAAKMKSSALEANKSASVMKSTSKPALSDAVSLITRRPPVPSSAAKKVPPPKKIVKEAVVIATEPRDARSNTPRKALDAPKHGVEVKRRVQDELDEERLRRIAEMHQKRVEQMEIERLRRLRAVEIVSQLNANLKFCV